MFHWFQKPKRPKRENVRFRRRVRRGNTVLPVEVVPSSRELKRKRIALSLRLVRLGAVVAAVAMLLSWGYGLWTRGVTENRQFAVGTCEFVTDGSLTFSRVQQALGLRADTCLLEVDLQDVREKLLAMPRIQRADVERRLPGGLLITISERRPVAWLTASRPARRGRDLLMDADGWIFESDSPTAWPGIPAIRFPDGVNVKAGTRAADYRILNALALVNAARDHKWKSPVKIERIHLDQPWMLMADFTNGLQVWFAAENLPARLSGLDYILTHCREKSADPRYAGLEPEFVNLTCDQHVPVRMRQPAETADSGAAAADSPPPAKRT